jgi:GntR family transcriptional regulator, transcriptional repressor for pyruvate dehydrogenase complex
MTDSQAAGVVFHGVRSESLSERVYRQVVDAIRNKRLAPGERLPSERELAAQFGVSRVIVREALRSLAATGWVDVRPGRGAFVSTSPGDSIARAWRGWLVRHRGELLELLAVRRALEELAAHEAAQRAQPDDIERIAANCDAFEMEAQAKDASVDRLLELDLQFHHAIAVATHGGLLPRLVDELATVLIESRRGMFTMRGRARWSAEDHRAILDAIAQGQPEEAAAAMTAHMDRVISVVATIETEADEQEEAD